MIVLARWDDETDHLLGRDRPRDLAAPPRAGRFITEVTIAHLLYVGAAPTVALLIPAVVLVATAATTTRTNRPTHPSRPHAMETR